MFNYKSNLILGAKEKVVYVKEYGSEDKTSYMVITNLRIVDVYNDGNSENEIYIDKIIAINGERDDDEYTWEINVVANSSETDDTMYFEGINEKDFYEIKKILLDVKTGVYND